MTEQILAKLEQLKELDAHKEVVRLDKQTAIDSVLTDEMKAQLQAVDTEFDPITENLNTTIGAIELERKTIQRPE